MKTLIHILTRSLYLSMALFSVTTLHVSAQQLYKISPQTTMTISGTSTLHNWTSTVENVSGEGMFTLEGAAITQVANLHVQMEVKSIKSGKGAMMDNNTYKALKAAKHPQISYQLQSIQALPGGKLNTTGKLTIGGESKTVKMQLNYQVEPAKLTIEGGLPILIRDYNIDPPTAMMGTIKTGEEVTIAFRAVFVPAKYISSLVNNH
jgi:polyisoprenoid-binding protein YceI